MWISKATNCIELSQWQRTLVPEEGVQRRRKRHREVERLRRGRISVLFSQLYDAVGIPDSSKGSERATVLEAAINELNVSERERERASCRPR